MSVNENLLILASYVKISGYRFKVVECLSKNGGVMIPTDIANVCGIRTNHISKVLGELKGKEIIECINEDARKGRLYRLTGLGCDVCDVLRDVF
jgi:predicted transcriptional regulator